MKDTLLEIRTELDELRSIVERLVQKVDDIIAAAEQRADTAVKAERSTAVTRTAAADSMVTLKEDVRHLSGNRDQPRGS